MYIVYREYNVFKFTFIFNEHDPDVRTMLKYTNKGISLVTRIISRIGHMTKLILS